MLWSRSNLDQLRFIQPAPEKFVFHTNLNKKIQLKKKLSKIILLLKKCTNFCFQYCKNCYNLTKIVRIVTQQQHPVPVPGAGGFYPAPAKMFGSDWTGHRYSIFYKVFRVFEPLSQNVRYLWLIFRVWVCLSPTVWTTASQS